MGKKATKGRKKTTKSADSIFDHRTLEEILKEVSELYLEDHRPWVIGYSGGKDSTATLQLVWQAISKIPSGEVSILFMLHTP